MHLPAVLGCSSNNGLEYTGDYCKTELGKITFSRPRLEIFCTGDAPGNLVRGNMECGGATSVVDEAAVLLDLGWSGSLYWLTYESQPYHYIHKGVQT